MLTIDIPGREPLEIESLVLDYNGTVAVDGKLPPSLKSRIEDLAKDVRIYLLTADTYGTAHEQCAALPLVVKTFPKEGAGEHKAEIVRALPRACCFGNGFNDIEMFKVADFAVAIIESEGMCAGLARHADVLVRSAEDAFDLLLKPNRLRATLRS